MYNNENKICDRCKVVFTCKAGNITECWCNAVQLSPEERSYIMAKYSNCLCAACLALIKKESASGKEKMKSF